MDSLSKIATRTTLLVSDNIFFAACISWLICVSKDVVVDNAGVDWADMPLSAFVRLFFDIFTFWTIAASSTCTILSFSNY